MTEEQCADWIFDLGRIDHNRGYTFGYSLTLFGLSYQGLTDRYRFAYWWGWALARTAWVLEFGRQRPRPRVDVAVESAAPPP